MYLSTVENICIWKKILHDKKSIYAKMDVLDGWILLDFYQSLKLAHWTYTNPGTFRMTSN